jgi:hypothetical protein
MTYSRRAAAARSPSTAVGSARGRRAAAILYSNTQNRARRVGNRSIDGRGFYTRGAALGGNVHLGGAGGPLDEPPAPRVEPLEHLENGGRTFK